ncbi:hypothetical protein, partial [Streptomyces sp. NPDC005568]|uniref:hypothetical protein n=1 Tax=Streptomyces sp. NPDC005568 TaxID=3156887 RepID=UPI0033BAF9AB
AEEVLDKASEDAKKTTRAATEEAERIRSEAEVPSGTTTARVRLPSRPVPQPPGTEAELTPWPSGHNPSSTS